MKQDVAVAMDGVGAGVFWTAVGFTLLVFSAPFLWIGEAVTDLRWHMGVFLLLIGAPGLVLAHGKRLNFGLLMGMGLLHCLPGVRVFLPTDAAPHGAGDELTVVEVQWGEAPTGALEDLLANEAADLVVVHGVEGQAREALSDALIAWPHEYAWPMQMESDDGLPVGPGTMVFSRYPIEDWHGQGFGSGAALLTGSLQTWDLDVPLVIAQLPDVGPGGRSTSRDELFEELSRRDYPERSLLLCRLGSSDSSPGYSRLRDATGLADARQGLGRMPTSAVTIAGLELPFLRVAREFVLHGEYVEVVEYRSVPLHAGERDAVTGIVDSDGPERWPVKARVRVRA